MRGLRITSLTQGRGRNRLAQLAFGLFALVPAALEVAATSRPRRPHVAVVAAVVVVDA